MKGWHPSHPQPQPQPQTSLSYTPNLLYKSPLFPKSLFFLPKSKPTPKPPFPSINSSTLLFQQQHSPQFILHNYNNNNFKKFNNFLSLMDMVVIDDYIFSIIVASLLGFVIVILFTLFRRRKFGENDGGLIRTEVVRSSGDGDPDVIVVGAGVAGAALAHTLAKDGRRVHVIERDLSEPDRIVGELLQPGGYLKLMELGLEDCVGDIDAQRVVGYGIFKDGKNIRLSYPLEQFTLDVAGRSFHNGRFIQRMREKSALLPNVRLEQGTVTSLLEEKGVVKGVQYKTKNGDEVTAYAPLTIVCDGCFSNLRLSLCSPEVEVPSHFVGLILENCQLPFSNHGHVIF